MQKLPPDPDTFKHFRGDPPETKLAAWRMLQFRLIVRDLAACLGAIFLYALAKWF